MKKDLLDKNILIAGNDGSGKSTFLWKLVGAIPSNAKILFMNEGYKFSPNKIYPNKNIITIDTFDKFKQVYPNNSRFDSSLTFKDDLYHKFIEKMVKQNHPDYLIVDELRGRHIFDYLSIINNYPVHALMTTWAYNYKKLGIHLSSSNTYEDVTNKELEKMITKNIDVKIFLKRYEVDNKTYRSIEEFSIVK